MNESEIRWPNDARCAVMLSFDVDGPTNWINRDKRVWNFPKAYSLGEYGPVTSVPRLLDLLEKYSVPATFYVPGWVAEHYPKQFQEVAKAGHEVGHHGYLHEFFVDKTYDEQKAIIERSQAIFKELVGREAQGFRSPAGDFSAETQGLLRNMGFLYSSSMRGDDRPYRTVLDGQVTDLVEIPARWELDDFIYGGYNYFPAFPLSQDRIASHTWVYDNFAREFDGYHRFGLCYVLMMHPQVIGRPGRIRMLERLVQHIKSQSDVWFATGAQIAQWWKQNY